MSDYKRLTKWSDLGTLHIFDFNNKGIPLCDVSPIDTDNLAGRLAELEDKIENGTLVELPKPFIEQQKEEPYAWQVFHAKVDIFAAAGKDIFPKEDKEAAEARLKELQEGKK